MAGIELIRSLLQRSEVQGSRSTILYPLGWLVAMLGAVVIGSAATHLPVWLTGAFGVLEIVAVLLYFCGFVWFALKNPDALRSEKFTLSKMMIEKHLSGDDLTGLVERVKLPEVPASGGSEIDDEEVQ